MFSVRSPFVIGKPGVLLFQSPGSTEWEVFLGPLEKDFGNIMGATALIKTRPRLDKKMLVFTRTGSETHTEYDTVYMFGEADPYLHKCQIQFDCIYKYKLICCFTSVVLKCRDSFPVFVQNWSASWKCSHLLVHIYNFIDPKLVKE